MQVIVVKNTMSATVKFLVQLKGRPCGVFDHGMVSHHMTLSHVKLWSAFEMAVAKQNKFVNDSSVVDLSPGNEGEPHKLGDGPVGKEPLLPPFRVRRKGEWSDIVDGGGLCSLGKWPIRQRRFPDSEAVRSLRSALVDSVEKFEQDVARLGKVFVISIFK